MPPDGTITENREIDNFDRLSLRAQHDHILTIRQGRDQSLVVAADPDLLARLKTRVKNRTLIIRLGGSWRDRLSDTLTTSLTRPQIHYDIVVKQLNGLEIYALARIQALGLETKELDLQYRGAGLVRIEALRAERIKVDFSGMGRMVLSGEVERQEVTITGPGDYDGAHLHSQSTQIQIRGPGKARVWAEDLLDVTVQGIGCVDYFGYPQLQHNLSPVSRLAHGGVLPQ